jgi:hypothetical protein
LLWVASDGPVDGGGGVFEGVAPVSSKAEGRVQVHYDGGNHGQGKERGGFSRALHEGVKGENDNQHKRDEHDEEIAGREVLTARKDEESLG